MGVSVRCCRARVLYSISHSRCSRTLTDLCFNPPLNRVGLLR